MATEPLPPSLQAYKPTQQEKQAYSYLFNKADNDQLGVLTGDLAVPFFSHSSLPPLILGEVWQLADPENSGFLTPERFGVACRLIGHAQEKKKTGAPEVREEWVGIPGPHPTFSNHPLPSHLLQQQQQQQPPSTTPVPAAPLSPPAPASRLQPQSTGGNALLTTISPEDKAKYARVFAGANGGKLTGLVDGEKARDIFIKSNLPYEVLGQVWTLADTHSRGALDLPDFLIGLHLVHLLMDGKISPAQLPSVLDPRLYAAAAGLPLPGQQAPGTPQRQSSLAVSPPTAPPAPAQQQQGGGSWAVSPQEKAESDQWFDQLDSAKTGRLEGEVAVGFFGQSGLEVGRLARVWDLSDLTSLGYLTKDTFAIAMHLLKSAVANPSAPLPETLPAELVPPSFRSQAPSGMGVAQRDLLDLMGDDDAPSSSSTPVPALQPQPTGSASRPLSPQITGRPTSPPVVPPGTARAISPQPTGSQAYSLQGTIFPQATGGSTSASGAGGFGGNFAPSASSPAPPPLPSHPTPAPQPAQTSNTFFDDNDDSDLASSASALSQHASQLRGTAREAEEKVEKEGKTRQQLEREVERLNEEVGELRGRIEAAREAHDREVERVEDLRRREKDGKENLARARQALIAAESDLSALRLSKTELEGEILRDKEDLRELQRRVAHVEEEKRVLEGEVEKLKKEVRGGKGRGAIARKQLASVEGAREGLEGELQRLQSEGLGGEEEVGEEGQVPAAAAAAVPLPATPSAASVLSPAASVRSTNPFDRLTQQQTAVSPQPTGGSTASTNPFAFASSPTATSPTAASPAPFSAPPPPPPAADQSRSEQEQPVSPSSLPYAAAAALGTGAVAALSAGAGVVAHALGVDGGDEGEGEKEGAKEGETDPFGVPVAAGSSSSSAAAPATATAEGGDGFEDAFSAAPSAQQEQQEEQGDAAAFDDAFADFPPTSTSTSTSATATTTTAGAPVEGTLGEVDPQAGFDDAFRDLTHAEGEGRAGKDAVEGTLGEVDEGAGFEEAFREVEEHHQPQSHAAKGQEEEDESSDDDDDDEGPEDVFSSSRTSASRFERSPSPSPSPNVGVEPIRAAEEDLARGGEEVEGATKTREPTNTSSESGGEESFVHVDAPVVSPTTATSPAATMTEDDLPPPGAGSVLEGTSHGVFNPIVGPAGTEESKGMLEDPAPVGFEPASPALSPSPSPAPPAALESPTEEKKEKRRAAPPPPTSRWPASTTSVPTPTAAAVDQGGFAAARPVEAVTAEDDFESAFADMGTSSSSTAPQAATATADFDDDAFDFKPDFADSLPSTTGTGTTTTSTTGGAGDGFDDAAFADFDSSFPAAGGAGADPAQPSSSSAAFDDAFASLPSSSAPTAGSAEPSAQPGAPLTLGAPITSPSSATASSASATPTGIASPFDTAADTDAPALPARGGPLPPTPKDEQVEIPRTAAVGKEGEEVDEVGAVGNLTALGFGREQAVEALQKYDYNLERAANYLVSQAAQ